MTDNEIIKALECCGKYHTRHREQPCEHCPFNGKAMCIAHLIDNTLDLINRQKAEILRLQNKVEILEMEKQSLKEDSDKSKATAMGVIKRQDAEIERLLQKLQQPQTEAVKEFAGALIKKAEIVSGGDYGFTYEITEDEIDNLVKEMVGAESG